MDAGNLLTAVIEGLVASAATLGVNIRRQPQHATRGKVPLHDLRWQ
jgi:hypothetical protein